LPELTGISFDVVNPHLDVAVDRLTLNFCRATNETTSRELSQALANLKEEIRQGLVTGDSLPELRKRVNGVFDNAEQSRAQTIAASEASRAVHSAQEIAGKESGVGRGLKWLASADACPICLALNGKEVAFGQPFASGVSENPAYSEVYFPPRHPNCNCAAQTIIDQNALAPGVRLDDPQGLLAWAGKQ
jgi:uncharacterized protein with gpF-like domain